MPIDTEEKFLTELRRAEKDPAHIGILYSIANSEFFNRAYGDTIMRCRNVNLVLRFVYSDHFTLELFNNHYYSDFRSLCDKDKDVVKRHMLKMVKDL